MPVDSLEVIRGSVDSPVSTEQLVDSLRELQVKGTLYLGYPVVSSISFNSPASLDAILVSQQWGIVIFDIVEGADYLDRSIIRDELYTKIQAKLLQHKELVRKRKLAVDVSVVTYAPSWYVGRSKIDDAEVVMGMDDLRGFLEKLEVWDNDDLYPSLVAALQAVTNIKNRSKRIGVKKHDSRGAKLKRLEESIANLDRNQGKAVIETVEGIQRIRGLAGSGKTIVLALKVAYLHATHPEWLIGVTFYTRSLKEQFVDLITKFTIEHTDEAPDWDRVRILHAWGSPSVSGIYYEICKQHNIEYLDYNSAKKRFPSNQGIEFDLICKKALGEISE